MGLLTQPHFMWRHAEELSAVSAVTPQQNPRDEQPGAPARTEESR